MFNHIINSCFKGILEFFHNLSNHEYYRFSSCWTLSAAYGAVDLSLLGMLPALVTFQSPLTIPPPLPILLRVSAPQGPVFTASLPPHLVCSPSAYSMHFHSISASRYMLVTLTSSQDLDLCFQQLAGCCTWMVGRHFKLSILS